MSRIEDRRAATKRLTKVDTPGKDDRRRWRDGGVEEVRGSERCVMIDAV